MDVPSLSVDATWEECPGEEQTLILEMTIPERHHAYLPESELGLPIIVAAGPPRGYPRDVAAWPKDGNGYRIVDIELPEGESYEDDIVLRGVVRYRVAIRLTGRDLPAGSSIFVSYQLCDDETLVCYPPALAEVAIP